MVGALFLDDDVTTLSFRLLLTEREEDVITVLVVPLESSTCPPPLLRPRADCGTAARLFSRIMSDADGSSVVIMGATTRGGGAVTGGGGGAMPGMPPGGMDMDAMMKMAQSMGLGGPGMMGPPGGNRR